MALSLWTIITISYQCFMFYQTPVCNGSFAFRMNLIKKKKMHPVHILPQNLKEKMEFIVCKENEACFWINNISINERFYNLNYKQ